MQKRQVIRARTTEHKKKELQQLAKNENVSVSELLTKLIDNHKNNG
jgi:predicted DNA-binding ribbon-helix-helix protein